MWGALAGAILAGLNMIVLWGLSLRLESQSQGKSVQKTTGILKGVALVDLIVFPLLGYFIGPMVL